MRLSSVPWCLLELNLFRNNHSFTYNVFLSNGLNLVPSLCYNYTAFHKLDELRIEHPIVTYKYRSCDEQSNPATRIRASYNLL